MHGLEVFNFSFENVHGGSIIAYASHKGAHEIQEKVPSNIYHPIEGSLKIAD